MYKLCIIQYYKMWSEQPNHDMQFIYPREKLPKQEK